jgi:hypothetical protein
VTEDRPTFSPLAPIERGPDHFSRKDIIARCVEPGISREALEPQVKRFASAGFLRPVGVDANDGRSPVLYERDSVLIAKCLHLLIGTSMDVVHEEGGIGRAVAIALKSFAFDDHFPNGIPKGENRHGYFSAFGINPAWWVLHDYERGVGGWTLHVGWTINPDGKRQVGAKLWNAVNGFTPEMWPGESEPLVAHAETVVALDRFLPMIYRDAKGLH